MEDLANEAPGLFGPKYKAFLETVVHLRRPMHRYCARMTGSVLDGEDVVQEALFEAYRKLETFDDSRPLKPWLFRIAHNRCIDLLRKRGARIEADAVEPVADAAEPLAGGVDRAVERMVIHLPPKERACVLLKDVFDESLHDIAELVGSTVGGVKAALHRGRGKLAALHGAPVAAEAAAPSAATPEDAALLQLYVERFNRRDWLGVRELISADARLRVTDCFFGRAADAPYFMEYEQGPFPWHLALGTVDGEPVIIVSFDHGAGLAPWAPIRMVLRAGRVAAITDYFQSPWLLTTAQRFTLTDVSSRAAAT